METRKSRRARIFENRCRRAIGRRAWAIVRHYRLEWEVCTWARRYLPGNRGNLAQSVHEAMLEWDM